MSNSVLRLENATIFQRDNEVLSDISLQIEKGEFVYLIGKTGSGKSSFLKTLYGDLPLTQGSGEIVNYKLDGLVEKDIPFLRRKLGVVFQDFKLLNDRTIYKNLFFVLKATGWKETDKIDERIKFVLAKVGMQSKEQNFPYQFIK